MKKRPDALFHGNKPYVTDYTIVTPLPDKPGQAATRAAEEKRKIHHAAATRAGHEFIPFAVETTGHFDKDCYKLFSRLADSVPPSKRYAFKRDILGAASTAIAEFRASAIINACFESLTVLRYR